MHSQTLTEEPPQVAVGRERYIPQMQVQVESQQPATFGTKMTAVGSAIAGTATKAGEKMAAAGTAVGTAVAGGAGFVYQKGKVAAQVTADKTKQYAV